MKFLISDMPERFSSWSCKLDRRKSFEKFTPKKITPHDDDDNEILPVI